VVVDKRGISLMGTGPNATSTIVTWRGQWSDTSPSEFPLFVQGLASDFVAKRITFQVCIYIVVVVVVVVLHASALMDASSPLILNKLN
jgi:hypothetical protein